MKGKGKKKGKKKSEPVEDVDPAHVVGSFDMCDTTSQFTGLNKGDGECTWVFDNKNLVEKAEEDKNYNDEQCDFADSEFSITVVDGLDDSGRPFVEFTHSTGVHGDYDDTYVGKKQKAKVGRTGIGLVGLTDRERQRLGIFGEEAGITVRRWKASPRHWNRGRRIPMMKLMKVVLLERTNQERHENLRPKRTRKRKKEGFSKNNSNYT
ncbi:hypothetical protein DFH07DRAFT_805711 [Mycena maculata]|uniref:Uncharacterized protein n=1 Tax=Mycena maculata TaxID=230809 RepID=A0AAD7JUN3_9AGAR|nr:hypothetical protein DFH07DRAFT_805711 [Mycena maculata]